ncbi:hypothetical protein ACIA5D_46060 [Actinoplanes sp. NPDC051513]|uniref:hypothetical protein n=1 Tax=Actinoplanes sp. NPDC051513 TaxID=3363908 RepID=UPI0037AFCEE2
MSKVRGTVSRIKRGLPIVVGVVVLLALTGAAPGPDASRAELTAYSLGCAVALIVAVKIVIKLFVYIVQAAVVVSALLALLTLVKIAVNAVTGE